MKLRHALILAAGLLAPLAASATCGNDCDVTYASDVQDCQNQFGDDPGDADDLAQCIQNARDDYDNCLSGCQQQRRRTD